MANDPLISIVVASYNYEKYITETLDSIERQTDKRFELIIVDDGSKDNSIEIIKQYIARNNNFHLYTHPDNSNKGLASTVLLAIEKARGEYIAFCESDDFWADNHCELLHKAIEANPTINIFTNGIKVINLSGKKVFEHYTSLCADFLAEHSGGNIFYALDSNYIPTFSAVCVKRSVLLQCDFNTPDDRWLDFWLWRQVCLNNDIYFIAEEITFWRKHNSSYNANPQGEEYHKFIKASNQFLSIRNGEKLIEERTKRKWRKYPKLAVKLYCCFVGSKNRRRYIRHKHIKK